MGWAGRPRARCGGGGGRRRIAWRHGRDQRARVGVRWRLQHAIDRAGLDDLAQVHHQHAVGDMAHHREVVRDEQHGEPERLLQLGEQVEHLRLHRDVERRHRLVADQQLRVERERARDADALALAAGEFVRIALAAPRRRARPARSELIAPARAARRREPCACTISGSSRMRPTVERGLSEPKGSWNTICMRAPMRPQLRRRGAA